MKLKIDAFRSIQGKTYELPESGLVRVSGVSGSGKSTLFDALEYLFWGTAGNTSPYGLKKTKVTLDWRGLSATRSKYPDKLFANDDVDESAQEILKRFLGVSETQFGCSGYVRQDMSSGILAMSPADQLRLVQNLAFESVDPEEYKAKVKVFLSETNALATTTDAKISALKDHLSRTKTRIETDTANLVSVQPEEAYPFDLPQKAEVESSIAEHRRTLAGLQSIIARLNAEINSSDRMLDSQVAALRAGVEQLSLHADRLRTAAKAISVITTEERQSLATRVQVLGTQLSAFNKHTDALALVAKAKTTYEAAEAAWINASMNGSMTFEMLTSTRERLETGLQEARMRVQPVPCPSCGTSLTMKDGALVHAHTTDGPSAEECSLKISKINNKMSEMTTAQANLQSARASLQSAEQILAFNPLVECPTEEISRLNEVLASARLAESSQTMLLGRVTEIESQISEESLKLHALTERQKTLALRDVDVIKSEIATANVATEVANRSIQECEEHARRIASWESRQSARRIVAATRAEQERSIAELRAELDRVQIEINMYEVESSVTASKIGAAQRLIPIITEASTRTVGSVVAAINDNANTWVERFFPRTGTRVMLRNVKVNKDETRRAQMSTIVMHDGNECRLQDMSGGERSRIILAFQLAMSTMFKCPLLMLDEPFKGLDPDLRESCMEALQEFSVDRLVLVAEHTIDDSWFEAVIRP